MSRLHAVAWPWRMPPHGVPLRMPRAPCALLGRRDRRRAASTLARVRPTADDPARSVKSRRWRAAAPRVRLLSLRSMAKDTEKLIRQLSLISYLMAERRPVTALEIRGDVEGYSGMNEDAFARRFYADRAELESLGIQLSVDRPVDGLAEQESYSLPPGELLPAGDRVHRPRAGRAADRAVAARRRVRLRRAAAPRAAADLVGPPEPLRAPDQRSVALGITASAGRARRLAAAGQDRHRDLAPQDDHVRVLHDGARRGWASARSTPTSCSSRAASSTSSATRTSATPCASSGSRASAARSPTRPRPSTTSSAPRTSTRASTPTASTGSSAIPSARPRSRSPSGSPGRSSATSAATASSATADDGGRLFTTAYADSRQLISWVLGLGEHARLLGPPELVDELAERVALLVERHRGEPELGAEVAPRRRAPPPAPGADPDGHGSNGRRDAAIRPERFARLVTLASILIEAGREGRRLPVARGLRAPPDLRPRSCARTSACSTSSTSAPAPTSSTPRSTTTGRSRSTPSPTATRSPGPRACCRSRPRRWSRPST